MFPFKLRRDYELWNITFSILLLRLTGMVHALIELGETEDRVVTIVQGKYGLKTKSDAINLIIEKYREEMLDPHLRPEFAERLGRLTNEKGTRYSSIEDLRKESA